MNHEEAIATIEELAVFAGTHPSFAIFQAFGEVLSGLLSIAVAGEPVGNAPQVYAARVIRTEVQKARAHAAECLACPADAVVPE